MIGLESRAGLALGQDDEGVENLVELGQVEQPAVVGETLVPDAAHLGGAGETVGVNGRGGHIGTRGLEAVGVLVEVDRVSEAGGAVKTADAVSGGGRAAGAKGVGDAAAEATEHAPKGPGRVDGEEDVVEDDKDLEGGRLANGPGLLAAGAVEAVEQLDGDGVGGGNGQGHAGVEGTLEDRLGDVEGVHDGEVLRRGGDGRRRVVRREVEELALGPGAHDTGVVSHGDGVGEVFCCGKVR